MGNRKIMLDTEGLYCDSRMWSGLGNKGMLFFIRLLTVAEHFGGFEANAESLKLQMGGLKVSAKDIEGYLCQLGELGKLDFYESNDKRYGWLSNYLKHQKYTHPAKPGIPLPGWITYDAKKRKYIEHKDKMPNRTGMAKDV